MSKNQLTTKRCVDCSTIFTPRYTFETRCYYCWRAHKQRAPGPDEDGLLVQNAQLLLSNAQLYKHLEEAKAAAREANYKWVTLLAENSRLKCDKQALQEQIERLRHQEAIPGFRERLPLLIRLSHPDRHEGSRTSTEVTQWLLQLKRELS